MVHAYLWVDEWARVEELWDLEEAWLAGNDPSVAGRMTRSVAGTFFDMYCFREKWMGHRGRCLIIQLRTRLFGVHLCARALLKFKILSELTSTIGISSGPGPGWLGPFARLRLGYSGHMFCRRWLCIFFLCFLFKQISFAVTTRLTVLLVNVSNNMKRYILRQ